MNNVINKSTIVEEIERLKSSSELVEVNIVLNYIEGLLNQLDYPEVVEIQQYIADWIEKAKTIGYNIEGAMENAPEGVSNWLELSNIDVFANAWVNGYKIKKEKRYTVKIKNLKALFCYLAYIVDEDYWCLHSCEQDGITIKHTRKELEDAGFSWVFNCEGVEVKEL